MYVGQMACLNCTQQKWQTKRTPYHTLETESQGEPKRPRQFALEFLSKFCISSAVVTLEALTGTCPFLLYLFGLLECLTTPASGLPARFSSNFFLFFEFELPFSHVDDVSIIVFLKILFPKAVISCYIFKSHNGHFKQNVTSEIISSSQRASRLESHLKPSTTL